MIKVYADTSVFGGVFDDEFRDGSLAFLEVITLYPAFNFPLIGHFASLNWLIFIKLRYN